MWDESATNLWKNQAFVLDGWEVRLIYNKLTPLSPRLLNYILCLVWFDILCLCGNFYSGHSLWISLQALSSQLNITLHLVGEMGVVFPAPSGTPPNQGPPVSPPTTPCSKGDQNSLHWKEAGACQGGGARRAPFADPNNFLPATRDYTTPNTPHPLPFFLPLFQDSVTYPYTHSSTSAGPRNQSPCKGLWKRRGGGGFKFEVCTCISMWRASK